MFITIAAFLFVLGLLVIVHEFGHLIAAKKLNMKVEKFSIGLGPKIKGIRKGETEYVISAIPLGGFVALSEEPAKGKFDPASAHFLERPPLHKMIVCLSGPLMNLLLALILFIVSFSLGVSVPVAMDKEVIIGWVSPESPSSKAGLRAGDRIIKINQKPITKWQDLTDEIPLHIGKQVQMEIMRHGRVLSVPFTFGQKGEVGISPIENITIGRVVKDSPAEHAGLRPGDRIIRVNGQPVFAWNHFLHQIAQTKSDTLALEIARDDQRYSVNVKPNVQKNKKVIGIMFQPEERVKKYPFLAAVYQSVVQIKEIVVLTGITLWRLVTLDLSIEMLGGPIMIAQMSGQAAKSGVSPLVGLIAFLSVQLGLFNLIPFIPIVDGGQIALFTVEAIRKRPLSAITAENLAKAGWAAMIVLIVVVSYNDIMRLF